MHTLKVRIWSNELNQFVLSNTLVPATNPAEFRVPKDCIMTLYLGFKDDNGIEVYEGDIFIQLNPSIKHGLGYTNYYEVVWIEEEAGFGAVCIGSKEKGYEGYENYEGRPTRIKRMFGEHPWGKYFNRCLVIGNIFENPEFKKKKQ